MHHWTQVLSFISDTMHLHWEQSHNTAGDCNIRSLSWMGRVPDEIPQVRNFGISLCVSRKADNISLITNLNFLQTNHFGVIAGLFPQIGGHSSTFVLFCSFWRLFTIKMMKSVKVFPFSFWKLIIFLFYLIKIKPRHKHAKWQPSNLTPWTLTLPFLLGGSPRFSFTKRIKRNF